MQSIGELNHLFSSAEAGREGGLKDVTYNTIIFQIMLSFKSGKIPEYDFIKAIKKPIPIRCIQINEPFRVETREGILTGKTGDYLMVGVKGELYPCSKEIFAATYDIVHQGSS